MSLKTWKQHWTWPMSLSVKHSRNIPYHSQFCGQYPSLTLDTAKKKHHLFQAGSSSHSSFSVANIICVNNIIHNSPISSFFSPFTCPCPSQSHLPPRGNFQRLAASTTRHCGRICAGDQMQRATAQAISLQARRGGT